MAKEDKQKLKDQLQQEANQQRLNPSVKIYTTKKEPRYADRTGEFKKDWARLEASGLYDMSLLKTVMMHLMGNEGPLPEKYMDHPLSGKYKDHRDCHINGDWVLIYKLDSTSVIFVRTGTHSELFKK